MDKAKKFLRKLSDSKQDEIDKILSNIEQGKISNLDVKKLKGYKNLLRVRVGDIRIVFSQNNKETRVLFVGSRGDSKYRQF